MEKVKRNLSKVLLFVMGLSFCLSLNSCNMDIMDKPGVKTIKIAEGLKIKLDTTPIRWAYLSVIDGWIYNGFYYSDTSIILDDYPENFIKADGLTIRNGGTKTIMATEDGSKFYEVTFEMETDGSMTVTHKELKRNR